LQEGEYERGPDNRTLVGLADREDQKRDQSQHYGVSESDFEFEILILFLEISKEAKLETTKGQSASGLLDSRISVFHE
jgi:hypothetical protein